MSKINLPPLPEFDIGMVGQVKFAYSLDAMEAYAEQAVREALAAQKPVAWMTEDGRVSTDVTKRTAMPNASQVVFSIPLALIPESHHE